MSGRNEGRQLGVTKVTRAITKFGVYCLKSSEPPRGLLPEKSILNASAPMAGFMKLFVLPYQHQSVSRSSIVLSSYCSVFAILVEARPLEQGFDIRCDLLLVPLAVGVLFAGWPYFFLIIGLDNVTSLALTF